MILHKNYNLHKNHNLHNLQFLREQFLKCIFWIYLEFMVAD